MKRLSLALCGLLSLLPAAARKPAACFGLPCAVERGKYVVTVGTAAGPRRFVFDTGASRTCISERLRRELDLPAAGQVSAGDFEGHRTTIPCVRIPRLALGEASHTDVVAVVLPDSSYLFRCLGFDGVVGSDLLRRWAVRISAADSTIVLSDDVRSLGVADRRRSVRLDRASTVPVLPVSVCDGGRKLKFFVKFDTGSPGFVDCRYDRCLDLIGRGILRDVRHTVGHSGNLGWTNRSVVREAVRGVIPSLELGGVRIEGVPLEVTHGAGSKLGCGLLRYGDVVVDYPGRRLWLLPRGETSAVPAAPLRNVTVALDGGRLVVGQVWDESLAGTVAPGDRIVRLGSIDVERVDPCAVVRGEIRGDRPEMTVERSDGERVTSLVKNL